jgi:hypothetical protein
MLYAVLSLSRFNKRQDEKSDTLEKYTANGNPYLHLPDIDEFENGYRIYIYIANDELKQEWNKRSEFSYDSLDRKGQLLKKTLFRYMTSMGLRKDSAGIAQLSGEDIHMVEKGYTNYLYKNKFALYPRIYELLWEMRRYKKSGDPSGQSLGQRIEYIKTGWDIVGRHFWWGTGTGDVQQEFEKQYELNESLLKPEWRHRTHNQFITFWLTFGIFGFLWFLFAMIYPPFIEHQYRHFLFTIFFLIAVLSMLNEDTLETHVGVSFFAFFYSFLLFSTPRETDLSNDSID